MNKQRKNLAVLLLLSLTLLSTAILISVNAYEPGGWRTATIIIVGSDTGQHIPHADWKVYNGFWFFIWWIRTGLHSSGGCHDTVTLLTTRAYEWQITPYTPYENRHFIQAYNGYPTLTIEVQRIG